MAKFFDFNDIPRNQYRVILADPDWEFKTYSEKGKTKSPDRHYLSPTSAVDSIANQPVRDFIHPDGAVLFLWVTWPHIFSAKQVIEAWGFEYSGLAWEWDKYNPETGKRAFGGGYITRKNLEPCLVATTKGFQTIASLKNRSTRDLIRSPRREHSRKPDEQYNLIEGLFDGPYLELYARQEWPGWDAMGNEVDTFRASKEVITHDNNTT